MPAAVALTDLTLPSGVIDNGNGTFTLTTDFSADTFISEYPGETTTNYGNNLALQVERDNGQNKFRHTFLGLTLPSLGSGIAVSSASITIHLESVTANQTENLNLLRLDNSFTELTTTWATGLTWNATVLGNQNIAHTATAQDLTFGTNNANLRAYIEGQIAGTGYLGFAIVQSTTASSIPSAYTFTSSEASSDKPKISFTFTFPAWE